MKSSIFDKFMLQNIGPAIRNITEDLVTVISILGHPTIAVPTAIYLLAMSRFSTEAQISLLTAGFFIPGLVGIVTNNRKYKLIGLGIGIGLGSQLLYLTLTETNRMIQEGCNPPSGFSYLEKYLFCKYGK